MSISLHILILEKKERVTRYSATLCNFQECNHINTSKGPLPSAIVLQYAIAAIRNPSNTKNSDNGRPFVVDPIFVCIKT